MHCSAPRRSASPDRFRCPPPRGHAVRAPTFGHRNEGCGRLGALRTPPAAASRRQVLERHHPPLRRRERRRLRRALRHPGPGRGPSSEVASGRCRPGGLLEAEDLGAIVLVRRRDDGSSPPTSTTVRRAGEGRRHRLHRPGPGVVAERDNAELQFDVFSGSTASIPPIPAAAADVNTQATAATLGRWIDARCPLAAGSLAADRLAMRVLRRLPSHRGFQFRVHSAKGSCAGFGFWIRSAPRNQNRGRAVSAVRRPTYN